MLVWAQRERANSGTWELAPVMPWWSVAAARGSEERQQAQPGLQRAPLPACVFY